MSWEAVAKKEGKPYIFIDPYTGEANGVAFETLEELQDYKDKRKGVDPDTIRKPVSRVLRWLEGK